jgi:putative hydrolases of HD superfamily
VTPSRLEAQIEFLLAVDALKGVLRQTPIADGSRRENTAEHSWQLALAASVLAEHAEKPIDTARVVAMLLVHDLVEIDAGDTFVYTTASDPAAKQAQDLAEQRAAERIFGLLPVDQGQHFRALWDEFEAKQSAESQFAKSIDRLMPMILNRAAGGGSWKAHGIHPDRTRALIDDHIPNTTLREYAHGVVTAAITEGAYGDETVQR